MSDPIRTVDPLGAAPAPSPDEARQGLREELDRSHEEILRLRDLLIAKDAEMGALKGRVAELESYARLLVVGAAQLSRIPGLRRLLLAPMRRLLGRRGPAGA